MNNWIKLINKNEIPFMGSRRVLIKEIEIAIFKTKDGSVFAINNICPHKQGQLSEGLVHEHIVTCPLHNWDIDLEKGEALGSDSGCTNTYETKVVEEVVYINVKS